MVDEDDEASNVEAGPSPANGRRREVWAAVAALVVVAAIAVGVVIQRSDDDEAAGKGSGLAPDAALSVDGIQVSETNLAQRVQVLGVLYGLEVPSDGNALVSFRRDTAQSLASSIVIDQEARAQGIAVDENDVDAALGRYLESRYTGDREAAFSQELAENGITEKNVRDEIASQLNGQQLFLEVTAGIEIDDADIRAAYEADPGSWAQPQKRQLRHIAVRDRATARRALNQLRGGADFADVAQRLSEDESTKDVGGELGVLPADQLDPAFATEAFRAARGALFGPVKASLGWYVGQVERIVPARTTYAQLAQTIDDGLSSQRALEIWRRYVEQLIKDAAILYADAYQPRAGDATNPPAPSTPPGQPAPDAPDSTAPVSPTNGD